MPKRRFRDGTPLSAAILRQGVSVWAPFFSVLKTSRRGGSVLGTRSVRRQSLRPRMDRMTTLVSLEDAGRTHVRDCSALSPPIDGSLCRGLSWERALRLEHLLAASTADETRGMNVAATRSGDDDQSRSEPALRPRLIPARCAFSSKPRSLDPKLGLSAPAGSGRRWRGGSVRSVPPSPRLDFAPASGVLRGDQDLSVLRQSPPCQLLEPGADSRGQTGTIQRETKLHRRLDLVDVLPAGTRGAKEVFLHRLFIDRQCPGHVDHGYSPKPFIASRSIRDATVTASLVPTSRLRNTLSGEDRAGKCRRPESDPDDETACGGHVSSVFAAGCASMGWRQ